jgi:hypothetical protein
MALPSAADMYTIAPGADLRTSINSLVAGDTLLLEPGTYELTGSLHVSATGTEAAPIVIASADAANPAHIHREGVDQNIIDIDFMRYVTLDRLRFSGGSRGLRLSDVQHFTLSNSEVFDTADVAVAANDGGDLNYVDLRILHNHIHDTHGTGEGLYLGCNGDTCRLVDSLIANNHVHHTNAADVEQGDGIEVKVGSYHNVIRDNVVHDTHYPCITLYGTLGNGDNNIIDGNAVWRCGINGIDLAGDVVVTNNIVIAAEGDAFHTQEHDGAIPGNLTIIHNTFITANDALALRSIAGPAVVANNAIYSRDALAIRLTGTAAAGVVFAGNVGSGGLQGAPAGSISLTGNLPNDVVAVAFDASALDAFPIMAGALAGSGDASHVLPVDFNGTPRNGIADVGAFAVAATNPLPTISETFKAVMAEGAEGEGEGAERRRGCRGRRRGCRGRRRRCRGRRRGCGRRRRRCCGGGRGR